MALKIAQLGQPVLRTPAKEVAADEIASPDFQAFVDEMLETMEKAHGVGLAAPQVFRSQRLFLAAVLPKREGDDVSRRPTELPDVEVFINPRLEPRSDQISSAWEGCLSFIELSVLVPRPTSVRVEYLDRDGNSKELTLEGFAARVVQHEYDHLDGVLTIDRVRSTHDIVKSSELESILDERHDTEDAPAASST